MLTPTDVEQKTFSTALRGYDLDEVDDFLDEIVATLRDLNEDLEAARGAEGAPPPAPPEPAPAPTEPAPAPTEPEPEPSKAEAAIDESAIGRALIAAQNAADKLLEDAQSEATKIVDDAKGEADTWRVEREAKKAEAEAEIAALGERISSIRSELSVLAGELADKLDEMDAVIDEGVAPDAGDVADVTAETETGSAVEIEEGSEEEGPEEEEPVQPGDAEEGPADESTTTDESSDELDEMLNGVASDLQLPTAEEPEADDATPDASETDSGEDE